DSRPGISFMNNDVWPLPGTGTVPINPVVPSRFCTSTTTVVGVADVFAIASPVRIEPAAPPWKSPADSANTRNAVPAGCAGTPASDTTIPCFRKENIARPDGAAEPLDGVMVTD